jgi:phosphate starvation-inducible membrane PsiE
MSKTKAFLLSVGIVLVVFLISAVVHMSRQLGVVEELCVALCVAYFLIVSTCFWSDKSNKEAGE